MEPHAHLNNVVITVVATVVVLRGLSKDSDDLTGKPASNPSPVPAPSSSPPVLVENVTGMQSQHGDVRFVLAEELNMTPAELAHFNEDVTLKSRNFSPWYAERDSAPIDVGLTTITLRGNAKETVRITGMKAIKDCREPFSGTFFQGYTQGRPTDTVKIGIDLDAPEPTVQELAITAGRGLHPFGPKYFTVKTIELAPGEVETLSIGAFTKRYGCSFTLQIIVATSYGSFSQDIDNHGKPFEMTAMAAPTEGSLPFSGYKAAYLQNKVLG